MAKKDKTASGGKSALKVIAHGVGVGFRWISKNLYLAAFLLFLIALASFLYAPSWGDSLGNTVGRAAGIAKGSFYGITEGAEKGYEEGKKKGLSAEDTVARIGTTLLETQNLQVLQVDSKLSYVHRVGDYYAALLTMPCTGIFTVDLEKSEAVLREDGSMLIVIPEPEFTPYIDMGNIETLAEYKTNSLFDGNAKDGYDGFLNSMEQLKNKTESVMTGYGTLEEQAKQVAKEQVEQLARSVCGSSKVVEVQFIGEART